MTPSTGAGTPRVRVAAPSTRAGRYVRQAEGYQAFHPAPYPPSDLRLNPPFLALLSQADMELGRLVGAAEILPNPDLFVRMYVRREAVLSSQIEGTQASLLDVLEYEAMRARRARRRRARGVELRRGIAGWGAAGGQPAAVAASVSR